MAAAMALPVVGTVSSPVSAEVVPAAAAAQTPDAAAVAEAAVPRLQWGECADDGFFFPPGEEPPGRFECADAAVPLDYDQPRGKTITVALKRRLADQPGRKVGSLFINPGGPGGSGVDFVTFADYIYSPDVLRRFDVIGFDPRGVARSTPAACYDNPEEFFEDVYRFLPTFPVTPEEERRTAELWAKVSAECAKDGDEILEHMSTADVARDLDLLRRAVGDRGLTYAGYSYGSVIGTTYANMFPGNVRALVVDGVVDPVAWTTGVRYRDGDPLSDWARRAALPSTTRIRSAEGSWATLLQFFQLCRDAGGQRCALAQGGDPRARWERLAARLRQQPVDIPLGGGLFQRVGYAELVSVTQGALYEPLIWRDLADLVVEVEEFAAGRVGPDAAAQAEALGQRWAALAARLGLDDPEEPEEPVEPAFQIFEGQIGVVCADADNPSSPTAWSQASREADRRAPYFGRSWTWWSIPCATWPAKAVEDRYAGPWDRRTSTPVLVVGNRYDPATPYSGAQVVDRLLPASRLLTLEGWGHVALGRSQCIDQRVNAYLLRQALPPAGTVCRPDVRPFEEPPVPPGARTAGPGGDGTAQAREQVIRNLPVPGRI